MKNNKILSLSLVFVLINVGLAYSHALYIDTDSKGKVGKSQELKIYYSELEDKTVEKVADWYSDVADFELWLIHPDGKRIKLNSVRKENHFVSDFTPDKKGKYRLEISHIAEDPGEETAYQFNAFAEVSVGQSSQATPLTENAPDLLLIEQRPSKEAKIKIYRTYFKGEPVEGISTTLFLPSGEKKTFTSNSEGDFEIRLDEKGIYFLEATSFQKQEAGRTEKAPYESVWRCATQKIEVI